MKALIIFLSLVAIVWFIVARCVNKYSYDGKNGDLHLPDSPAFLIAGIICFVITLFVVAVPAQECGVVVTPSGVKTESYKTGWHIILPWYKVERMDKTVQVYTCASLGSVTDASDDDFRMLAADVVCDLLCVFKVDSVSVHTDSKGLDRLIALTLSYRADK